MGFNSTFKGLIVKGDQKIVCICFAATKRTGTTTTRTTIKTIIIILRRRRRRSEEDGDNNNNSIWSYLCNYLSTDLSRCRRQ
jgi:hypothetical protein